MKETNDACEIEDAEAEDDEAQPKVPLELTDEELNLVTGGYAPPRDYDW